MLEIAETRSHDQVRESSAYQRSIDTHEFRTELATGMRICVRCGKAKTRPWKMLACEADGPQDLLRRSCR
jgi:hypothetical protein